MFISQVLTKFTIQSECGNAIVTSCDIELQP